MTERQESGSDHVPPQTNESDADHVQQVMSEPTPDQTRTGPHVTKKAVLDLCGEICKHFQTGLKEAIPTLTVPATRQECADALQTLTNKYNALLAALAPLRLRLESLAEIYELQQLETCDILEGLLSLEQMNLVEQNLSSGVAGPLNVAMGQFDSAMLQTEIAKMLKGQPQEIRKWWLFENNQSWQHLDKKQRREQTVAVGCRIPTLGIAKHVIPPSVASLIFSNCDLESCVALRQVNSTWYSAYNQSEAVLKSLLTRRCPWIAPQTGSSFSSWADCALVLVSRLKSKKWTVADDFNELDQFRTVSPINEISAVVLKKGQKLPENFSPLHPHTGSYCTHSCGCLHFEFAFLNLKSMEYTPQDPRKEEDEEGYHVLSETDEEIVIDWEGTIITLPALAKIDSISVDISENLVVVQGDTRTFVFPRDKCHYKHVLLVHLKRWNTSMFVVGDLYVRRDPPNTDQRYCPRSYHLFDPYTKRFVQYAAKSYAVPVASYNGLVWWLVNQRSFIPTFMDLDNPGKFYIRKDKILTVAKDESQHSFDDERPEGFVGEGNGRFVTRPTLSAFQVVDLETGTVNHIRGTTEKDELDKVVVGYENDKFHARYVSNTTWTGYMEEAYMYRYW